MLFVGSHSYYFITIIIIIMLANKQHQNNKKKNNNKSFKMASQDLRVLFFSDFEFQFILNIVYIVYLPLYPNMLLHINGVEKGFRLSSNGRNARSRP